MKKIGCYIAFLSILVYFRFHFICWISAFAFAFAYANCFRSNKHLLFIIIFDKWWVTGDSQSASEHGYQTIKKKKNQRKEWFCSPCFASICKSVKIKGAKNERKANESSETTITWFECESKQEGDTNKKKRTKGNEKWIEKNKHTQHAHSTVHGENIYIYIYLSIFITQSDATPLAMFRSCKHAPHDSRRW